MPDYVYGVYEAIVSNTSSELILFFIILAMVTIPLYMLILKGRKVEKQHEREREQLIIAVIKENSAVIAGLKTTLDNNGASIEKSLERLHARLDLQSGTLNNIDRNTTKIKAIIDREKGTGDNE